jgi:hypothetical protein
MKGMASTSSVLVLRFWVYRRAADKERCSMGLFIILRHEAPRAFSSYLAMRYPAPYDRASSLSCMASVSHMLYLQPATCGELPWAYPDTGRSSKRCVPRQGSLVIGYHSAHAYAFFLALRSDVRRSLSISSFNLGHHGDEDGHRN